MKILSLIFFIRGFLPFLATADDFLTISPNTGTKLVLRPSADLVVVRPDGTSLSVPLPLDQSRYERLGTVNLPERKFQWANDFLCVATISNGFGILDTREPKWICNTVVKWGFAYGRSHIAYVEFRHPLDTSAKSDSMGVYRFDRFERKAEVACESYPLKGFVISPIFENRSDPIVAFIQQLPDKEKQLVIFGTDTGKILATRTLPKRFASRKTLWVDDIKKEGRQQNRELLEWIESATKYGPFWEPDADGF